jgi:hypothetical protein
MRSHRGNQYSNNRPHRITPHSTDKGPYYGSGIHGYIIKDMQTLNDNMAMHTTTIEDLHTIDSFFT